jgi:hypothetical protein
LPSRLLAAATIALLAGAAGLASGAASDTTPDCPASVGGRPLTNHVVQGDPAVDASLTCYYDASGQPSYGIAVSWVTAQSDGHNAYGCGRPSPDPETVFVSPDHEADASVNSASAPPAYADAARALLAEVAQRFAKPCASAKLPRFRFSAGAQGALDGQPSTYVRSAATGSGHIETSQLDSNQTARVKRASGSIAVLDVYKHSKRRVVIRITGPGRDPVGQFGQFEPYVHLRGVVTNENRPGCHSGARADVYLEGQGFNIGNRLDIDACDVHDHFAGRFDDRTHITIRSA